VGSVDSVDSVGSAGSVGSVGSVSNVGSVGVWVNGRCEWWEWCGCVGGMECTHPRAPWWGRGQE